MIAAFELINNEEQNCGGKLSDEREESTAHWRGHFESINLSLQLTRLKATTERILGSAESEMIAGSTRSS